VVLLERALVRRRERVGQLLGAVDVLAEREGGELEATITGCQPELVSGGREGGNGAPVQPQKTVRSDLGLLGELGLNKVLQSTGLGGLCELAVADFLPLVSCEERRS
jgi:hypothetical protein